MYYMKGTTVSFRLDPETACILRELTRRRNGSRSETMREALRVYRDSIREASAPTAWEVYSKLINNIPKARPYRDTARHVEKLLKEKRIAKRRKGTL